ncbi:hypothetical protein H4R19_001446 [Coemansia spiralis]|nr:hypothetical protein H4R19_001446 [Coemansia spiralis]
MAVLCSGRIVRQLHSGAVRTAAAGAGATDRGPAKTFEQLGIDSKLAAAMGAVHGAVVPNAMQAGLVRQLVRPRSHLAIRQPTGTGKTYAIVAAMVSLAVQEHQALAALGVDSTRAFELQALNTLFVVPNRELALQIERWAADLLAHAYPAAPRAKYIQRFVSGTEYETVQRRVLRRHGVPAIAVGTPRSLLELAQQSPDTTAALLAPTAPGLLKWLADAPSDDNPEYLRRLKRAHGMCRQGRDKDSSGTFGGLRRLVVDEIDQILRLPGKYAPQKEKQLRLDKPRPGQQLVDRILLETCGMGRLRALVEQVATAAAAEAATAAAEAEATSKAQDAAPRRKSNAKGWRKTANDPLLAAAVGMPKEPDEPESPAVKQLRSMCHLVGPRTVQLVTLSATAIETTSEWMRTRGWMTSDPIRIDNSEGRVVVPRHTTHHCLVIEDGMTVRNLRPKDKTRTAAPAPAASNPAAARDAPPAEQQSEQIPMMELMAEAAANAIEYLQPQGAVVIFTRSDASTTRFGHVLERFGIRARDIMARFDPEIQQLVQRKELEDRHVFIATEEAARGIDLPDASLVLILDIPNSAASYAHMSGRAGRYGRKGTVLSVVPGGHLGHFESKMRGIFAHLDIQPTPAPFVSTQTPPPSD